MEAGQIALSVGGKAEAPTTDDSGRGHLFFLTSLVVMVGISLWLIPVRSSLWLDETGTYWLIKDGVRAIIHRTSEFQGQSPLYYLIAWAANKLGPHNEIALRLPSLVGATLATWLVYRLGKRLFDADTGLLAAIAFSVTQGVMFAAADARAYAIALAALVASALAFVRWVDEQKFRLLLLSAVAAAATLYLHYLIGIALLANVVYLMFERRAGRRISGWQLLAGGTTFAVLLVPLIPDLTAVLSRRGSLSVPGDKTMLRFISYLVPAIPVVGLIVGGIIARKFAGLRVRLEQIRKPTAALIFSWLFIPPIVIFGISYLTSTQLTFPRYFLSMTPAAALILGRVARAAEPARARRLVAVGLVVISIIGYTDHNLMTHSDEDWRGVTQTVNAIVGDKTSTPVLLDAGFIESSKISWLKDGLRTSYLEAPVSYYPVSGHVYPMPFLLGKAAKQYLETLTSTVLLSAPRFLLIMRPGSKFDAWFDGRLTPLGYRARFYGNFGVLELWSFVKAT